MMAKAQDIFAFRSQFPEFASIKDADLAAVLNTADIYLDADMWSARDFPLARMYWVAHMLTLSQQQAAIISTTDGGSGGSFDLYLHSIRIGERTISFSQRKAFESSATTSGPGEQMLSYTYYGQMFIQLRTRNIIPIAVV